MNESHDTTDEATGRGLRRYLIDGSIAVVGILALTGGVLASLSGGDDVPRSTSSTTPEIVTLPSPLAVSGAYAPERGAADRQWVWLRERGAFVGSETSAASPYLAFRALSLRQPRTLTVGGTPVKVGTSPQTYITRPKASRGRRVSLTVAPGPVQVSATDRRKVSVFATGAVASNEPSFALPGQGFFDQETDAKGTFYWMGTKGTLDLITTSRVQEDGAKVRLVVWSPAPRTVLVRRQGDDGDDDVRTLVPAGRDTVIEIDDIALVGGRRQLLLTTDGGSVTGKDPRKLSIQLRSAELSP